MSYLFRLGCAGVAIIAIAALTSIGLYAVVAGGVLFGAPSVRATPGAPPVLVTIQAAPVTPTVVLIPTSTPMPSSLIPGLGQPPAPALAAPAPAPSAANGRSATGATAAAQASPTAVEAATVVPAAVASPRTEGMSAASQTELPRQATHDGLSLEVFETERGWQARGADGAPIKSRDGFELLTVHVRLMNRAAELRFVADSDILLVSDDGARFASRQAPPLREPYLLTLPVPPGDGVRGWLTYEVPADSTPRRVQWSPTRPDRPRADATFILALP